jgi:hypothetical protein
MKYQIVLIDLYVLSCRETYRCQKRELPGSVRVCGVVTGANT